jgi:hypothetical protein
MRTIPAGGSGGSSPWASSSNPAAEFLEGGQDFRDANRPAEGDQR